MFGRVLNMFDRVLNMSMGKAHELNYKIGNGVLRSRFEKRSLSTFGSFSHTSILHYCRFIFYMDHFYVRVKRVFIYHRLPWYNGFEIKEEEEVFVK